MKSKDFETIFHFCETLLFNENKACMKKKSGLFDVTMGAHDEAEVCEFIGIFTEFETLDLKDEHYILRDFNTYLLFKGKYTYDTKKEITKF